MGDTAPRASNAKQAGVQTLPDSTVSVPLPAMLGPAGAPAVTRDAEPAMGSCFSVGEGVVSVLGPVQAIQPVPLGFSRKLTFLFWRTASKRVNFSMSETLAAALLSW